MCTGLNVAKPNKGNMYKSANVGTAVSTCRTVNVTIWQNADDEKMQPSWMSGCKDADFAKRRF